MCCDLSALNHLSHSILLGLPVISIFMSFVCITDDRRGQSKVQFVASPCSYNPQNAYIVQIKERGQFLEKMVRYEFINYPGE